MQFVINIGKTATTARVLMVKVVLDYANPEASTRFGQIKPKIFHRIILSLSDQDPAVLLTAKGKVDAQNSIVDDLNAVLKENRKTGVKDVFFTDFIVQ